MNNGHWSFPEQMDESNAGFVYAIVDTVMGMGYIGKKNFKSSAKGMWLPSDWRTYKSSSKALAIMFNERPVSEFEFICLEQYKYKGDLSYAESWSLFRVKALESKGFWYNKGIEAVAWQVRVPPTPRHRERIAEVVERVYGKNR